MVSNLIDKSNLSDEFYDNTEYIFIEFTRSLKTTDANKFELIQKENLTNIEKVNKYI